MLIDGIIKEQGDVRPVLDRWTGAPLGSVTFDTPSGVDLAVTSVATRRRVLPVAQRAEVLARTGNVVRPTVLDRVPADATLVTEETFGPVAPVIRVRDADEAVTGFDSPHIPFGGVKASGYGREGMRYAIQEMSVIKTITVPLGRES